MDRMRRRQFLELQGQLLLGAGSLFLSGGLAGCGGPKTASPYDVLRPPDERTATTWLLKAFRRQSLKTETRDIQIERGAKLTLDVASADNPWGVAWLTADEQESLKGKLPEAPAEVADGALWVHRGVGEDDDERILILTEQSFKYDPDPRGDGVVRSILEVEARVVKDVTDFLVRAKRGEVT